MNVWESKVKSSSWANFSDIKNMFRSADYVDGLVIFNIQGNNHRLVIEAAFHEGAVAIKWVGTHADYDKKCKKGGFKL
ncbi:MULTISPECIES: type II toxin-antitoxin system HigB family toxin [Providencia]|nr:type II toxin-antitoxin system HigB family toxin [Providencia rettgeri]MDU7496074.1 type II toxin-antitoxin system HigB family toxin [Providencia rettgeri]HEM8306962.1 type II toxin-antitoxin system HigB family toxin [Providencia rettgeri]